MRPHRRHPHAIEQDVDYSAEPTTLIEFVLEQAADGVMVTESGFDQILIARRAKALGDETRLRLDSRLCNDGPQSITKLTTGSSLSRQAISKHLQVMDKAGLVHCTRRGRESLWQLDQHRLGHARRYLKAISKQWDDALGSLREFVEE